MQGQVPTYALIGNGRVARHMATYFDFLRIPFVQFARSYKSPLQEAFVENVSKVLILLSDNAIENFILEHPFLKQKKLIHFSASLTTPHALGVHPLFTFTHTSYDFETYKKIPFIVEKNLHLESRGFPHIFPELPNPWAFLDPEYKNYYHALCVMAGNFSVLLWQKLFNDFETKLNLDPSLAKPYLERIFKNISENPNSALTGPLSRGDTSTIEKNLNALENDPHKAIYEAFIRAYKTKKT